ncbi:MAG TPA: YkgJ family cysteine cluster protein [Planctomycetota bacterium]
MPHTRHVRFERGAFRFSGDCDACRPACRAVCCRGMRAPLADEEIASGRYESEAVEGRIVLRQKDGGCVYLGEDDRCSIYADRPAACRRFDCSGHRFQLYPITAPRVGERGMPPVVTQDGRRYHYSVKRTRT